MTTAEVRPTRALRSPLMPLADAAAWSVALVLASVPAMASGRISESAAGLIAVLVLTVCAHWAGGYAVRLYDRRDHPAGLDELFALATASTAGVLVLAAGQWFLAPLSDWSIVLMAWPTALIVAVAARVLADMQVRRRRDDVWAAAEPVIVFGGGDAGSRLVRSMLADPSAGYRPVAVLDDDRALRRRVAMVAGVPVRGDRSRIGDVAAATGARTLVLAIPSATSEVVREVSLAATDAGLTVRTLPPLSSMLQPLAGVRDLRDLDINDLLGRRPVQTDIDSIVDHIRGRRVLVTGAGGSIGSELCRQLHRLEPAELIMLDRDESALHAVQLSIEGRALLDSPDVVLADIRDATALRELFLDRRPQVVFHAAALKHLPMLEQYPAEAWKTNVLGTLNVLDASAAAEVECFVNISTDKAANPVSVLGQSKRITERLVAHMHGVTGRTYLSVRFGNVLGSRGSVLTTFSRQISSGRPLTITHPDVTRYFMTIPESVELVLQAAAIGREPEVMVLDMGEPVRIVDLAKQLMRLFGTTVPIVFTGLRDGEKLHEELLGPCEIDHRPLHVGISQVGVPPLSAAEMGRVRWDGGEPVMTMAELTRVDTTLGALPVVELRPAVVPVPAEPGGPELRRLPDVSAVLADSLRRGEGRR